MNKLLVIGLIVLLVAAGCTQVTKQGEVQEVPKAIVPPASVAPAVPATIGEGDQQISESTLEPDERDAQEIERLVNELK